jgi:hypothetical protein
MKTKKYRVIAALLFLPMVIAIQCSDDFKAEKPSVSLQVSKNPATVEEDVIFTISGEAEFLTLWTGDEEHNYEGYLTAIANGDTAKGNITKAEDSGVVVDRNSFTYQYPTAGTYKIVLLASNAGEFGDALEVQKIEYQITIQ